jgi:hypothetical protein
MLVVLRLNFFLFEPEFVLVFRLTRLSSSRRWAGMTADFIACQMSSCLCQDYNILLLFKHKRDILYTGNISSKKIIKIKQAFKIIRQPRTFRYFFGEIFKLQWKSGACATNFPAVPEIDLNEIENLKNVLKSWTLFTVGLNLDNLSLRTVYNKL